VNWIVGVGFVFLSVIVGGDLVVEIADQRHLSDHHGPGTEHERWRFSRIGDHRKSSRPGNITRPRQPA